MNTQMEEQNYTVTVCLPYIPPPLNPPHRASDEGQFRKFFLHISLLFFIDIKCLGVCGLVLS